jgi:carboxylesterase type B
VQPTYLYELAYTVPKIDAAPHGADNPLVFGDFAGGTADRFYVQPVAADTESLGKMMRRARTEFAHTGDPGWDAVTSENLPTMVRRRTVSSPTPRTHARGVRAGTGSGGPDRSLTFRNSRLNVVVTGA